MTTLACTPVARTTKSLLGYGVLAGPLYVLVSLAQAVTRPGAITLEHDGGGNRDQTVRALALALPRRLPTGYTFVLVDRS